MKTTQRLSFESIAQRDVVTLQRRDPLLSLHRRQPALRRLCKWFCREQERMAAEQALKIYRTALRAHHMVGTPLRLGRRVQTEMYGRIGRGERGPAWR